ncbi:MAG TPA: M20/M25/M40 family metallo-hydrolase [Bryobacteraceae bacterium]|nr:M20/M25/M40 family metallo-hydrolase [Bryobacteraceae bacterium]
MNVFELTRALVDIDSVTPNEEAVGLYLLDYLSRLAPDAGGRVERMEVEHRRFNVLASWGPPVVTFSTHIDTVPPFWPSRDDGEWIWGRGACDAKGIAAAMIGAVESLLEEGLRGLALLFVVGEERNSAGAYRASQQGRGSRYLVNGEPTENMLALGSKGALRYEISACGKMAHSAYPELGESAIEKLLDALDRIRRIQLPRDPLLGQSTLNIGTIQGGRAPNVIPDQASAEIFVRLVDSGHSTRKQFEHAVSGLAQAREILCLPALRLGLPAFDTTGFQTTIVSFTTDIPAFGETWGKPFLIGPGAIHLAHTSQERVRKADLLEAVEIYKTIARQLIRS